MDTKKEIKKIRQILSEEKFVYRDTVCELDLLATTTEPKNKALSEKPVFMFHGFMQGHKIKVWSHDVDTVPVDVIEVLPKELSEEKPVAKPKPKKKAKKD